VQMLLADNYILGGYFNKEVTTTLISVTTHVSAHAVTRAYT